MSSETNSKKGRALNLCESIHLMKSLQGERKYHLNNSVEFTSACEEALNILKKQSEIINEMRTFNINENKFVGKEREYILLTQKLLRI